MRQPYKMRAVVGWFLYRPYPPDHAKFGHVSWPKDVLECGHTIRMPIVDSTVDAMRAAFETTGLAPLGKRRCYKCAAGEALKPSDWRGLLWNNGKRAADSLNR